MCCFLTEDHAATPVPGEQAPSSLLIGSEEGYNESASLGDFKIRSRRADYITLMAGNDLEWSLKYVRIKHDDVVNALAFIQNNCDLSWRNGHIVSRTIGSVKIDLPRLERHLTMGFLFSGPRVGRNWPDGVQQSPSSRDDQGEGGHWCVLLLHRRSY